MSAMTSNRESTESSVALTCVVLASVLVAFGAGRGVWASNLHNGVFGISFSLVGAWLLWRRPGQKVARLFLVMGVVSAAMYLGRQIGLDSSSPGDSWWGWLGVWPTALAIALATGALLLFPEGTFLSRRWRLAYMVLAWPAVACAGMSALWPVEYTSANVATPFPYELGGVATAEKIWNITAHPVYLLLQVLLVAGIVARWRASDSAVRRQILGLVVVSGVTLLVLLAGLLIGQTPTPGLLALGLLPPTVGWALSRVSLAHIVEVERARGTLAELSPRENDVLELMAQGLSNSAIAERLFLSIKTVEPVISSIFRKLNLDSDSASNRRVLAVAEWWRRQNS